MLGKAISTRSFSKIIKTDLFVQHLSIDLLLAHMIFLFDLRLIIISNAKGCVLNFIDTSD